MFFPERLHIPSNSCVLEIGPGGSPFYRSDILFDKFYDNDEATAQSGGTGVISGDKPLIISSEARLPFKDNAFDYVICSHVLEHVELDEISHFIDEIKRVSVRGYIEFPSIFYESLFDFFVHKNILFLHQNVLYVISKEQSKLFNDTFHYKYSQMRNLLGTDRFFSLWILLYKRFFFIGGEYNQDLRVQFIESRDDIPNFIYPESKIDILKDIWNILKFIVIRNLPRKKYILSKDILECPRCNGKMIISKDSLLCTHCKTTLELH